MFLSFEFNFILANYWISQPLSKLPPVPFNKSCSRVYLPPTKNNIFSTIPCGFFNIYLRGWRWNFRSWLAFSQACAYNKFVYGHLVWLTGKRIMLIDIVCSRAMELKGSVLDCFTYKYNDKANRVKKWLAVILPKITPSYMFPGKPYCAEHPRWAHSALIFLWVCYHALLKLLFSASYEVLVVLCLYWSCLLVISTESFPEGIHNCPLLWAFSPLHFQ